jgi:hypothetical protein
MKITFEPKLGLDISISNDGDFVLSQTNNVIYVSIGQMRTLAKKLPDLMKVADEKRSEHLNQGEVR